MEEDTVPGRKLTPIPRKILGFCCAVGTRRTLCEPTRFPAVHPRTPGLTVLAISLDLLAATKSELRHLCFNQFFLHCSATHISPGITHTHTHTKTVVMVSILDFLWGQIKKQNLLHNNTISEKLVNYSLWTHLICYLFCK